MPSHVRARPARSKEVETVRPQGRWIVPLVLLCFVTSGAASLILETTLTRLLRLVLGNTTLAVTTVLCAFMGGLALGGYLGGRLSERTNRPLRAYAILEGAIGLACLLLPLAVHALQPLYRGLYLHVEDSFLLLSLVRFLFCGLLVLVPATFMGATLPILSRWYAARTDRTGRAVAWLYSVNSLGAVAGVLTCTFVLLPGLGVGATIRTACMMGLAVCLVGLMLDRMTGPAAQVAPPPGKKPCAEPALPARRTRLEVALLLAYGLSGAAALVYEVAWTRILSLLLGSSVYAFSLMLAAFILGLALGSAITGRFVDRMRDAVRGFAAVELAIGLTALAAVPLFGQLPVTVVRIVTKYSHSFAALQAVEFALIVLIMIVPTTLMGAAFVLVGRACMSISGRVGRSIGEVYAANTVGAVIGAFTATFVWIPWIGTQNTILLASAANVAIGALFLLPGLRPVSWRWIALPAGAIACLAAATLWLPAWDAAVMSSGGYLYASWYAPNASLSAEQIRGRMQSNPILYYREDIGGTVAVRGYADGDRALVVGGKIDASRRGDLPTQLLLAHAPLLLHPQPRSALVVGLASGMTVGAAATYDLERIDCVEISRAVVEASHYFDEDNGHVLDDKRVRLIIGDGRNHVALTDRTYDVIISEPSNPWIAGVADLFTLEYFQACRSRLNPGGLACVWLQAYNLEDAIFRSIARTFQEAFPHMIVLETQAAADYLLIGSADPIRTPYASMARRIAQPAVAASLARIDIRQPLDLLQRIVLSGRADDLTADADLHTDDSVLVEFAAPRSLYGTVDVPLFLADLYRQRRADLRMVSFDPGQEAQEARVQADLVRRLQARTLAVEVLTLWSQGSTEEAIETARKAFELEPAACDLLVSVGKRLLRQATIRQEEGDLQEALHVTSQVVSLLPHRVEAHVQLADLYARSGNWAEAAKSFRAARTREPQNQMVLNSLAWLLATAPDPQTRNGAEAVELAERICTATDHKQPLFLRTLAASYAETGRFDDAVRTATTAGDLAVQNKDATLAQQIQEQIALYRQGQPCRQTAGH